MKLGRGIGALALVSVCAFALAACASGGSVTPTATPTASPSVTTPLLAVVGDYGSGDANEKAVADLVAAQHPTWFVSTGDNVYSQAGYPKLVGDYYGAFLASKHFVPATGNHDYTEGIENYDAYFGTNAGSRFYVNSVSPDVDLFVLDSQAALNLTASWDAQQHWLKQATAASLAKYKIVILHHPPYGTGAEHGSTTAFKWDYKSMGVTAVFAGHEHLYERLNEDGVTYVTTGAGGKNLYSCGAPIAGSVLCEAKHFGALFVFERDGKLSAEFRATDGTVIDQFDLQPAGEQR